MEKKTKKSIDSFIIDNIGKIIDLSPLQSFVLLEINKNGGDNVTMTRKEKISIIEAGSKSHKKIKPENAISTFHILIRQLKRKKVITSEVKNSYTIKPSYMELMPANMEDIVSIEYVDKFNALDNEYDTSMKVQYLPPANTYK